MFIINVYVYGKCLYTPPILFISCSSLNAWITEPEPKNKSAEDPQPFKIERQNINQYYAFNPGTLVSKLNEIEDIKEKFHTLESLNCSENKILFADSFSKNNIIDLRGVQTTLFEKDRLNVVIIGAGPCGLYLSNALKYQLRHKINILVLDNHCNEHTY